MDVHQQIEELMALAVIGGLSETEQKEFEQHLSSCPQCQNLYKEEQMISTMMQQALTPQRPGTDFEERMVRKFRRGIRGKQTIFSRIGESLSLFRFSKFGLTLATAAIGLLLIHVGGVLTGEKAGPVWKTVSQEKSKSVSSPLTYADGTPNQKMSYLVGLVNEGQNRANANGIPSEKSLEVRELEQAGSPAAKKSAANRGYDQMDKASIIEARKGGVGGGSPSSPPVSSNSNPANEINSRKLIRNADLNLKVDNFEASLQTITRIAGEEKGFVATSSSSRLGDGKMNGQIVIKVLPENLDTALQKLRALGEVENQSISTQDITTAYFDTEARLRNAKRMETRLLEMLASEKGKMAEVLQVEKELARVREQIERMQGELKLYDSQVSYATIRINLYEKNLVKAVAIQETQITIESKKIEEKVSQVKEMTLSAGGEIRSSTFERSSRGGEVANLVLRIAMIKNNELVEKLKQLGKVKDFTVRREDQNLSGKVEEDITTEITLHLYSQSDLVSDETGFFSTLRKTVTQGVEAIMWSLRMIGVALAFIAPWGLLIGLMAWVGFKLRKHKNK
jgi:hypothetical protein